MTEYDRQVLISDRKTILSAVHELAQYINEKNTKLLADVTGTDQDEPEFHDHQTCGELQAIANRMLIEILDKQDKG